jgi:hypothetical protein
MNLSDKVARFKPVVSRAKKRSLHPGLFLHPTTVRSLYKLQAQETLQFWLQRITPHLE